MSVVENISKNSDELQSIIENMQSLMAQSESGAKMLQSSQQMGASDEMIGLMELIGEPSIPEAERIQLSEYMGAMMKDDPVNGLNGYADYLQGLAGDPKYQIRKEYYQKIADAAKSLNSSEIYQSYIVDYQEFENDNSDEANQARTAMNQMQEKMQQWASGETGGE